MEEITRNEAIDRIVEFEDNAGYGMEDMPQKTAIAELRSYRDRDLVDLLEDLTTNYGIYKIID